MHRALRILLRILAGLVVLIVILVGALLVRIAVSPLSVDFLNPSGPSIAMYIQEMASTPAEPQGADDTAGIRQIAVGAFSVETAYDFNGPDDDFA